MSTFPELLSFTTCENWVCAGEGVCVGVGVGVGVCLYVCVGVIVSVSGHTNCRTPADGCSVIIHTSGGSVVGWAA